VIPLLAIVFYIYTVEIKKAISSGNWDAIYAGLTLFGMDFINETWNGWVFHFKYRRTTDLGVSLVGTNILGYLADFFPRLLSFLCCHHPCSSLEITSK
jgi:hypothetical protein